MSTDKTEPEADPGRVCGNCGAHVSAEFTRVMVPEGERPRACTQCTGKNAVGAGAPAYGVGAGRDVRNQSEIARAQRVESACSHTIRGP